MNRRMGFVAVALVVGGILTASGMFSQVTIQPTRKVIKLAGGPVSAPFSDGILSGNTLYLAGRIGHRSEALKGTLAAPISGLAPRFDVRTSRLNETS